MEFNFTKYIALMDKKKFNDADNYRIENIPKKLYKFIYLSDVPKCNEKCDIETLNEIKINSLRNKVFWLSTCENLNDPFELKTLYLDKEKTKKYNYPIELVERLNQLFYNSILIGCFTTNLANNMPMWAHYANNHKGFCIEYKIKKPKFFYPISYEEERAPANVAFMNYFSLATKDIQGTITDEEKHDLKFYYSALFHNNVIKHKSWKYENEYRLLFSKHFAEQLSNVTENGATIDNNILGIEVTGIYLGMSCNEIYKDKLKQISKELGINSYQMYFDDKANKYELSYKITE